MTEDVGLELLDKVPQDARIVFVGINPSMSHAATGRPFSHPSNQMYRLLGQSGIAARHVTSLDVDWLVEQGIGFTDVVKRPSVGVKDLVGAEYDGAATRVEAALRGVKPRVLAFVSKKAARAWLGVSDSTPIQYGPAHVHEGIQVWFLPSTSGQSYRDTTYAEKLIEFQRLATFLHGICTCGREHMHCCAVTRCGMSKCPRCSPEVHRAANANQPCGLSNCPLCVPRVHGAETAPRLGGSSPPLRLQQGVLFP